MGGVKRPNPVPTHASTQKPEAANVDRLETLLLAQTYAPALTATGDNNLTLVQPKASPSALFSLEADTPPYEPDRRFSAPVGPSAIYANLPATTIISWLWKAPHLLIR